MPPEPPNAPRKSLTFDYVYAKDHRTVPCSGVFGGLTPLDGLFLAVYSEHIPVPQRVVHGLNPDGTLGAETSRTAPCDLSREVHVTLMLDAGAVVSLRDWLTDKIAQLEKRKAKRIEMKGSAKE